MWVGGSNALERRRVRSRAEHWARQWPTLPAVLRGVRIEVEGVVERVSQGMMHGESIAELGIRLDASKIVRRSA